MSKHTLTTTSDDGLESVTVDVCPALMKALNHLMPDQAKSKTMNEVRTRVHTAAVMEAVREVQAEAGSLRHYTPRLNQAIHVAVVKAEEAHAAAVEDSEEADRYQKYTEMIAVAKEYYTLLEDGETPPEKLKVKLDILLEPFSDDPAFTAFCQMKRAAAGLD